MYQYSYEEILEDDQHEARRIEAMALERAMTMLTAASELPSPSIAGVHAVHYTRQLWTAFIGELAAPENALPNELRANLISIGIWILKEAESIRLGKSTNYLGIADICGIVRDGLL